jgi:hypothetical protein
MREADGGGPGVHIGDMDVEEFQRAWRRARRAWDVINQRKLEVQASGWLFAKEEEGEWLRAKSEFEAFERLWGEAYQAGVVVVVGGCDDDENDPDLNYPVIACCREKLVFVADLEELKIPAAMRPGAELIIALTDMDDEYAGLARHVVAKLARRRSSPIQSGRAPSWAGGVVYALGQVNFLFDSDTKPYLTADDLSTAFEVGKSTLSGKAKQIRDLLKMSWGTPEFLREEMIEASPAIWYIQVDGLIVDARALPLPIQAQAFELGVIPYIPALGRAGTAERLSPTGLHDA